MERTFSLIEDILFVCCSCYRCKIALKKIGLINLYSAASVSSSNSIKQYLTRFHDKCPSNCIRKSASAYLIKKAKVSYFLINGHRAVG